MHGRAWAHVSSLRAITRLRGCESHCPIEALTLELARQPLQCQGASRLEGIGGLGERPWEGEGEAGKVVLAWERVIVQAEEGGVGAGEMWDTEVGSGDHGMMVSGEGERSEGDGMEMLGARG